MIPAPSALRAAFPGSREAGQTDTIPSVQLGAPLLLDFTQKKHDCETL